MHAPAGARSRRRDPAVIRAHKHGKPSKVNRDLVAPGGKVFFHSCQIRRLRFSKPNETSPF